MCPAENLRWAEGRNLSSLTTHGAAGARRSTTQHKPTAWPFSGAGSTLAALRDNYLYLSDLQNFDFHVVMTYENIGGLQCTLYADTNLFLRQEEDRIAI